ncbi:MAG TPA: zinc ribbon domain-containing protein [Sandaracinaceae bacterium LLY-WYZ-13_1]|nr:zinc ribbon domain-containing protein [Sandaracinaceae bacterium LLY-WYZ-13_1]
MPDTPERCPTCNTAVPEGAVRCVACGRVFGEENRCPHCNAVAAVIQKRGKTVCAACGKPRTGTTVLGPDGPQAMLDDAAGRRRGTSASLVRASGRGQRAFGIAALGGGVLTAVLAAALLPWPLGLGLALAGGLLGVGVGALSLRAGAKTMTRADREEGRSREMAILELAEERGGRLTATDVAKELGLGLEEADRVMTGMVGDGTRVGVDVDADGVVHYVFREVTRPAPPRVRVAEEAPGAEEADAEEAEVEAGAEDAARERSAGSRPGPPARGGGER